MPTSEQLKQPKILIPEIKLQNRVSELAQEISMDYRGREVVAICILKGAFIFFSDVIRQIDVPMTCEFLGVSSYGNKMVIVFDDIVDTGLTLSYILNSLKARKPASIKSCCLMVKPDSLKTEVEVDYTGFKIGSEFVVGYGIDFAGQFRGLPYIGYIEHGH